MTDKELLEYAAKAAFVEGDFYVVNGVQLICKEPPQDYGDGLFYYTSPPWRPLTDDADALRLAAKLYLWEAVRMAHRLVSDKVDIYVATRISIVRAAAEIGKAMK